WTADEARPLPAGASRRRVDILDIGATTDVDRPGGALFGALVHAVLARVPFDASSTDLHDAATVEARVLGLAAEEAAMAAQAADRVLRHELFTRVRAAAARGACRREVPVTLTLDGNELVEGVADLAFEE